MEAFRSQKDMATYVIEVTEFNSEDICDLRGCLEAENGQKPDQSNDYPHFGAGIRSWLCGLSVKASDSGAVGQGFDSPLGYYHFVKR